MRRYITLVENLQTADFNSFIDQWGDYVYELSYDHDEPIDDTTIEDLYVQYLPEVSELGRATLYRGLSVDDAWIEAFMADKVTEMGVHWTTDLGIATSFSNGPSNYDDRFANQKMGRPVILQARDLDIKGVDVNPTVAAMMVGGEYEVRLKQGAEVFVASILIDGHWHMVGKTFRA